MYSKIILYIYIYKAQAIVVGFLASIGALSIGLFKEGKMDWKNALVVIAGSMSTASFASLLLGNII